MPDTEDQLRAQLVAALDKDGIPYPMERLPDLLADYADLRRFLDVIAAAEPYPLGDAAART